MSRIERVNPVPRIAALAIAAINRKFTATSPIELARPWVELGARNTVNAYEEAWSNAAVVREARFMFRAGDRRKLDEGGMPTNETFTPREHWSNCYSILRSERREMLDVPPGVGI